MMRAELARGRERWERAAEHADRAGDRREEMESLALGPARDLVGPVACRRLPGALRGLYPAWRGDKKALSSALMAQAVFVAEPCGWRRPARSSRRREGAAGGGRADRCAGAARPQLAGWVELLAGQIPAAGERELRRGYSTLEQIGELAWL